MKMSVCVLVEMHETFQDVIKYSFSTKQGKWKMKIHSYYNKADENNF